MKTNLIKHACILFFALGNFTVYAQNGNANGQQNAQWKVNGNAADSNFFIGTTNQRDLKFKVNNLEQLRINKNGNIGIGTTNPSVKLDVRGNVKIDSTLLVKDSLSVIHSARMGEDLTVLGNAFFKSNAEVIQNFNVLGQTTLNQTKISGPFTLNYAVNQDDLNNLDLLLRNPLTGEIVKTSILTLNQNMYSKQCSTLNGIVPNPTWSNGPNKIFIDCPEVLVGIGTNSPIHNLDVRGRAYASGGVLAGTLSSTGYSNNALFEGIRHQNFNMPLLRLSVRKTDGTNEVRFKVEGDGTVYCTSVKVRLSNTIPIPDFVFKPEYRLMPLSEVKEYVIKNSHLPNIPSEEVIRNEGLSIEEMQLRLLQKIEELTLYLIDLEEKSQQQEKDKVLLQQELEALKAQLNLK